MGTHKEDICNPKFQNLAQKIPIIGEVWMSIGEPHRNKALDDFQKDFRGKKFGPNRIDRIGLETGSNKAPWNKFQPPGFTKNGVPKPGKMNVAPYKWGEVALF